MHQLPEFDKSDDVFPQFGTPLRRADYRSTETKNVWKIGKSQQISCFFWQVWFKATFLEIPVRFKYAMVPKNGTLFTAGQIDASFCCNRMHRLDQNGKLLVIRPQGCGILTPFVYFDIKQGVFEDTETAARIRSVKMSCHTQIP